jgi:sulfate adenylyltransferase subunit 2
MNIAAPAFDTALASLMPPKSVGAAQCLTHLQLLEAESIHIIREAIAESEHPVLLYSIGKDSSVLVHLALKAFYPAKPPFPLLHIDTTWKFRDMIAFRDRRAEELGFKLIVHINQEGLARGIGPISHPELHTDLMKTQALRQALDHHRFDVALGGARRDEERSRAKERVFSLRNAQHRWDPKRQRAEPWRLYNGCKRKGESIRVFPLSNWTELDVWLYIQQERIPVVPLYFAAARPVVCRSGTLIMVDDDRLPLEAGERPAIRTVRFRTLGCYPLTGAIESSATSLEAIIRETAQSRYSERCGRLIDHEGCAAMERKKQEGYF